MIFYGVLEQGCQGDKGADSISCGFYQVFAKWVNGYNVNGIAENCVDYVKQ